MPGEGLPGGEFARVVIAPEATPAGEDDAVIPALGPFAGHLETHDHPHPPSAPAASPGTALVPPGVAVKGARKRDSDTPGAALRAAVKGGGGTGLLSAPPAPGGGGRSGGGRGGRSAAGPGWPPGWLARWPPGRSWGAPSAGPLGWPPGPVLARPWSPPGPPSSPPGRSWLAPWLAPWQPWCHQGGSWGSGRWRGSGGSARSGGSADPHGRSGRSRYPHIAGEASPQYRECRITPGLMPGDRVRIDPGLSARKRHAETDAIAPE